VKLGAENRKQVILLAVLGVVAVFVLARQFWPSSPAGTAAAPTQAASTAASARPAMRRTASGKMVPVMEPRLDPTLDLNLLAQSEEITWVALACLPMLLKHSWTNR
jgi:hypothetical protein